jgi:lipopolysaccharide transport system permease protein
LQKSSNLKVTEITARGETPRQLLWNLLSQRDLLLAFTVRAIRQRNKGTLLGMAWTVVNPLLMMGLYSTVFGVIFNGRYGVRSGETGADYAIGIFLSLTMFQLVAEVMVQSNHCILLNRNIVKKVVFPVEILPSSQVLASLFFFTVSMILVLLGIEIFGPGLSWKALLFPIVLLPVILLAFGFGWIFSAMGVYLRDLENLMQFFSLVLLYSSAVFYTIDRIPDSLYAVMKFNPLAHMIQQARKVMLWDQNLQWEPMAYSYLASLLLFGVGLFLFSRVKRKFADVL